MEEPIPAPLPVEEGPFVWPREMAPPHPLNIPGDFYTEDGDFQFGWDAPLTEAPDLLARDDNGHLYFKRQPETQAEMEQAIGACAVSFAESVRYRGDDPLILERLVANRCKDNCDVLVKSKPM
jgi:hypothetical protein